MASATDSKNVTDGPFSDPVFKKLARLNGEINKMTKEELKEKLEKMKLDTRGLKDVLKKRLKNFYKRKHLSTVSVRNQGLQTAYEFLLVIDFEATCDRGNSSYPHEIIEFPIVLVDVANKVAVAEFRSFVKPTLNQKLTPFCIELTGIMQNLVDEAPTFPEVLIKIQDWMASHHLGREHKFAVVTDGPWDMSRFMFLQCRSSKIAFPRWARKWINIRKSYCNSYQLQKATLSTMLEGFGLEFEGHHHSGIADARNIARIVIQMLHDGCNLHVNERMYARKLNDVNAAVRLSEFISVGKNDPDSSDEEKDSSSTESDNHVVICDRLNFADHSNIDRTSSLVVKDEIENAEIDDCSDLLEYISLRNS